MKLKLIGHYKSLKDFESDELADFTVVTGKNGTGKSQIIYCLANPKPENGPNKTYELILTPKLNRIKVSDLVYKSSGPASISTVKPKLEIWFKAFNELRPKHKKLYEYLLEKGINLKEVIELEKDNFAALLEISELRTYAQELLTERSFGGHLSLPEDVTFQTLKRALTNDIGLYEILFSIKSYKKKKLSEFERNDFFKTPFPDNLIDVSDMFESQIETIFFNYLKRRHENQYLYFRNITYNELNSVIDDKEFERRYPAPWELINKILSDNSIPLQVKTYNTSDYSDEIIIEIKFRKVGIENFITFEDLSSGERVIIGLIIKLFTEKYYETELKFPELVVLDEPDAYLHPEMSKLLIDVVYKSFVKDLGVKVIMTTHSPSTIALTPEDSIYQMSNSPICSLKKISKDVALEILTGMIPTLSIDYKNHKQIFLESPTDVKYFQRLFNKLNSEMVLSHKLYFISNEMGKSNSDWVKGIVSKLREGGVKKSFGIIDWDEKNKSSDSVWVHGENNRYSIENFLYDPIYLSILFLESNGANNIRNELKFDETYNHYNLANETTDRLQEIWDWVLKKVEDTFPALKAQPDKIGLVYYNNKKILAPKWFTKMQGHEMEEKLRKIFASLAKFTSEGDLQNSLSVIMAKCYPLVPKDSIELLKKLCL